MRHLTAQSVALCVFVALGACAGQPEVTQDARKGGYLGIQTVLLDGDMVSFRVAMKGAATPGDIEAYGRCAAAQYALIRGAGFVRHIRTNVKRSGDVTRADAVYLVSAALPRGTHTIDAEVTTRDCGERRIPTV